MTTFAQQHIATQAERLPRTRTAPTGFEQNIRFKDGIPDEGELSLDAVPETEQEWRDKIKEFTGYDLPASKKVVPLDIRMWGRPEIDSATGKPRMFHYVKFDVQDREAGPGQVDYTALLKTARRHARGPKPPAKNLLAGTRTRVVVLADLQIGKVDHRGGTEQLLIRLEKALGSLAQVIRETPCEDVVIIDAGDLTEGFDNTAQQAHTNDLSMPAQLDLANHILAECVGFIAGKHQATRVVTVPSNHGAWRRGKDRLGKPGDDFGILTHRTVARAFHDRDDIAFVIPDEWAETLAVKVRGAILGVAHGHQFRPGQGGAWWAKQTHGGGPLAAANYLISGHYHHLRVEPTGAIDGRARWWFQAPTLDNGSSWWVNGNGTGDTEPGLLTFTINDTGAWDHLRLITVEDQ